MNIYKFPSNESQDSKLELLCIPLSELLSHWKNRIIKIFVWIRLLMRRFRKIYEFIFPNSE